MKVKIEKSGVTPVGFGEANVGDEVIEVHDPNTMEVDGEVTLV